MSERNKQRQGGLSCWDKVKLALNGWPRVLLFGPPGTGKSYAAATLGLHPAQEVFTCTLTPETPAAELRGGFLPAGGANWGWLHGPAISAWLAGGRLVL